MDLLTGVCPNPSLHSPHVAPALGPSFLTHGGAYGPFPERPFVLRIAARDSELSKAQVSEVMEALSALGIPIHVRPIWVKTQGDLDLKTSLRSLGKTDFFTKEVDILLLRGEADVAIHSAKDLPDPLPEGLVIAALTQGIDASDVLVLQDNIRFEDLPEQPKIATSSYQREERVKTLLPDACVVDIRGNIQQRLALLNSKAIDGVVIAKAALLRLSLDHLNYVSLPGTSTPLQGRLAIVVREGDLEMFDLFSPLAR